MLFIFQVLLLFSMFVFLVGSYSKGEFSNKIPLIMFIFTSILFLFTVVVLWWYLNQITTDARQSVAIVLSLVNRCVIKYMRERTAYVKIVVAVVVKSIIAFQEAVEGGALSQTLYYYAIHVIDWFIKRTHLWIFGLTSIRIFTVRSFGMMNMIEVSYMLASFLCNKVWNFCNK